MATNRAGLLLAIIPSSDSPRAHSSRAIDQMLRPSPRSKSSAGFLCGSNFSFPYLMFAFIHSMWPITATPDLASPCVSWRRASSAGGGAMNASSGTRTSGSIPNVANSART